MNNPGTAQVGAARKFTPFFQKTNFEMNMRMICLEDELLWQKTAQKDTEKQTV